MFARGVLADARETGIGVGSMIPIRTSGYNNAGEWGTHTSLRYVKSVDWNMVTAGRAGSVGIPHHRWQTWRAQSKPLDISRQDPEPTGKL